MMFNKKGSNEEEEKKKMPHLRGHSSVWLARGSEWAREHVPRLPCVCSLS